MQNFFKSTYKIILALITGFLILNTLDISPYLLDYGISGVGTIESNNFVLNRNDVGNPNNNLSINNMDNSMQNSVSSLTLADKIKRKISWYITAKNRGTYDSYNHYKEYWNPNVKLWSQIKSVIIEDFRKARLDGWKASWKARAASDRDNERLMNSIRASRNAAAENRTRRYFERVINRKKITIRGIRLFYKTE